MKHTSTFDSVPRLGGTASGVSIGTDSMGRRRYTTPWSGTYLGIHTDPQDGVRMYEFGNGVMGTTPQTVFRIPVAQFIGDVPADTPAAARKTIILPRPFMGATVWDLEGYLTNLRGADLREAAAALGFHFKPRTKVGVIRDAIRAHYDGTAAKAAYDASQTACDLLNTADLGPILTEHFTEFYDRAHRITNHALRAEAFTRLIDAINSNRRH